jgi:hypothetical protein
MDSIAEMSSTHPATSHLPPSELQATLERLSTPLAEARTPFDPAGKKGGLAAGFVAFVQEALVAQAAQGKGVAAWAASSSVWREMCQVVSAAAGSLVQHVASSCWEEGALLAGLWNLHTGLLDAGIEAAHLAAQGAEDDAAATKDRLRRWGGGVVEGCMKYEGASARTPACLAVSTSAQAGPLLCIAIKLGGSMMIYTMC